ncbi:MAG: DUF3782 domain-containing protein [Magnetococcales bacterium]|nr:DUF3782 domain-containing protein [Magnetococcales bacterium]
MSETATFESVWKLLQETIQENRLRSAETDRKFAETDRKFQETDRMFRESQEKMERMNLESRRETDRVLGDLARQIGGLTSKWGQFVENLVAPGCETLFAQWGIPVHQVAQRVKGKRDDGSNMEVDILVVNREAVVLVEVKSTLTVADVRDHLQRLEAFKGFFPQYHGYRVMGAVAGIVSDEKAESYARGQGLFVIVQSGESVALANDGDFTPRSW